PPIPRPVPCSAHPVSAAPVWPGRPTSHHQQPPPALLGTPAPPRIHAHVAAPPYRDYPSASNDPSPITTRSEGTIGVTDKNRNPIVIEHGALISARSPCRKRHPWAVRVDRDDRPRCDPIVTRDDDNLISAQVLCRRKLPGAAGGDRAVRS